MSQSVETKVLCLSRRWYLHVVSAVHLSSPLRAVPARDTSTLPDVVILVHGSGYALIFGKITLSGL